MKTSSSMIKTASAGGTDSVLLTVSGALALIILVMVLLAWVARRSGIARRFNDGSLIAVVASKSLGARERIVLIDVEDQRLVLGVTATQINCLATLAKPLSESSEMPTAGEGNFAQRLNKLSHKYRGGAAS
ncbi:flagellar biosynthetic protein FliO [Erwinia aphidicola]|uniref:flagellar biosynthetic protein FliO n=1 Tax=Erwinia aphidicola TaxID=68334 RepID=UPI00300D8436